MKQPEVGDQIHVMTSLNFLAVGEIVEITANELIVKNAVGDEKIPVNPDLNHSLRPGGGPLRVGEWEYI